MKSRVKIKRGQIEDVFAIRDEDEIISGNWEYEEEVVIPKGTELDHAVNLEQLNEKADEFDNRGILEEIDGTDISNWDSAFQDSHTHTNKPILDGIDSSDIGNWDDAYSKAHVHANKSILDSILQGDLDNWNEAYNKVHTHANKNILDGISSSDIGDWEEAYNKKVNAISFTGDTNKTLTVTREDGTTLTAAFLDNNDPQLPDDVINTLSFNDNNDGVLRAITSLGEVISTSLDGRYNLLGHKHVWADITDRPTSLSSFNNDLGNYGNWITKDQGDTYYAPLAHVGTGGNAHALATTSVAGFMSSADKTKLNSLSNYTHPAKAWVDKSNLTGATVISNLTIDSLGHPTNWTTRALTPGDIGAAPSGHTHTFASLTGKPTTIGGYGITDFNSLGDARWALRTRTITAGNGLSGGGNLTANRTIALSTTTQDDIGKGVTAHGWGDFRDYGLGVISDLTSMDQSNQHNSLANSWFRVSSTADSGFLSAGIGISLSYNQDYSNQLFIAHGGIRKGIWYRSKVLGESEFETPIRVWDDGNLPNPATESWSDGRFALRTRSITGTGGLTGGGNLTANRTIDLSSTTKSDIALGKTAHGWGNHSIEDYFKTYEDIPNGYDLDNADYNGVRRITSSVFSSIVNTPSGSSGGALFVSEVTSSYKSQHLYMLNGRVYHRIRTFDSWEVWKELWHTGNLKAGTTAEITSGNSNNRIWSGATLKSYFGDNLGLQGVTDIGNWTRNRVIFQEKSAPHSNVLEIGHVDLATYSGAVIAGYHSSSSKKGDLLITAGINNINDIDKFSGSGGGAGLTLSNLKIGFSLSHEGTWDKKYITDAIVGNYQYHQIRLDWEQHADERLLKNNEGGFSRQVLQYPPESGTLATREWASNPNNEPPSTDPGVGIIRNGEIARYLFRHNFTINHSTRIIDAVDTEYPQATLSQLRAGTNVSDRLINPNHVKTVIDEEVLPKQLVITATTSIATHAGKTIILNSTSASVGLGSSSTLPANFEAYLVNNTTSNRSLWNASGITYKINGGATTANTIYLKAGGVGTVIRVGNTGVVLALGDFVL